MGYQAATVEMVPKVRKARQVPVDHVVSKEKRDELERSLLNKETGSSARGKTVTAKLLALLRLVHGKQFIQISLVESVLLGVIINTYRSASQIFQSLVSFHRLFLSLTRSNSLFK